MKEVRIAIEDLGDFNRRSLEMARRLDQGARTESPALLAFESMEGLLKLVTVNRWRLLRTLRRRGRSSIRALAQELGRDYRGVHADVRALIEAGLVERDQAGAISVPWTRITAEMALDTAA